jgi:hypothetical protein
VRPGRWFSRWSWWIEWRVTGKAIERLIMRKGVESRIAREGIEYRVTREGLAFCVTRKDTICAFVEGFAHQVPPADS